MHLVYYQPEKGYYKFHISNLSFADFYRIYNKPINGISPKRFFGSDLQKDYETKDVEHISNLRQLANYLSKKEYLVLNQLEFEI